MTPEERAEKIQFNVERAALLRRHLKIGDLLTHTRCMGSLEEHVFTGWNGHWLCGRRTAETKKYSKFSSKLVDDIAPMNVTHVNRDNVLSLDVIKEMIV